MNIDDSFKKLVGLKNDIRILLIDFIKLIVMLSSTLLALLISLNQQLSGNIHLFYVVLLLLLLCILSGIAGLYIVIIQHRTMDRDLQASISEQIRLEAENFEPVFSKYNKLQLLFEYTCVVSFLLSVITLVAYAFYR